MFNRLIQTALSNAVLCSIGVVSTAWGADGPIDPKIATNITITGCLHSGEKNGQFVLVGVTEKTATGDMAVVPFAIYMLDSSRDMKPLVGQLVDVKAVVVKRYSRPGTIKVAVLDDPESTTEVTVNSGAGKTVSTKSYAGGVTGPAMVELSRPVYGVNVDSIAVAANNPGGPACK